MTKGDQLWNVFADLPREALDELNLYRTDKHYKHGQAVFREGTPAFGLYFILSGHVKLYKTGEDGKQQIVRIAVPGDILGYRSLFDDEPYHVTASALDPACVCAIDTRTILPILALNPRFTLALLKKLVQDLNAAEDLATSIAQRPVQERMAKLLLMLKGSFGRRSKKGFLIEMHLSHEELGEMIGVTRETITRLLSKFKKEKIIGVTNRCLVILDLIALGRTAGAEIR